MMNLSLRLTIAWLAFGCAVAAVSEEDDSWLSFPSRHGAVLVHKDCVHHFDDDFHVEANNAEGDILSQGSQQKALPPCPHAPRWTTNVPAEGTAQQGANSSALQSAAPRYYSDWVGYAVTTGDFSYMSSDWVVPAAPKSTGPVPGISSVYFFNGLEDGGGVHGQSSYILQPVLTYGKSGCIIDPLRFFSWHFVSFSVTGAGRAYCGKRLSVKEGESIRGIMQLESDKKTWTTLSIRLSNNETSTQSTNLKEKQPNAAYVTLESMITYGCKNFPAGGSMRFTSNVLKDRSGNSVTPSWTKMLRHTECNQQVQVASDGSITITWDADMSNSIQV